MPSIWNCREALRCVTRSSQSSRACSSPVGVAEASGLEVPQSLKLEHEAVIDELGQLASRGDAVGVAAGKALPIVKAHFAKEDEFLFPPLSVLPTLAKGQISSDMRAAIAMTERAKAPSRTCGMSKSKLRRS
jgi:hypothetical protein